MNRFVIADPGRCIGCNTCMAACSTVHRAVGLQAHPRLTVTRTYEITAPVQCRHCEDAPCARVCPVDAIKLTDGQVVLNEQTCIGCKMCAIACPFGAITPSGTPIEGVAGIRVGHPTESAALDPLLAWSLGVRSVAVKCDLCSFQEAGPECVRVCPTAALHVVNAQSLDSANAAKRLASATASATLNTVGFDAPSQANTPSIEERD
ncbi:4Fe-4S dicluster domain-containing protein [Rhodopseudomonas palustris]|uniref:4Fe-4S ferredoxin, iron-sulfur binding n=1 Tax=Rhodopseudomonas palustris (strain BisB18) TaxID=316056 RepID=Q20XN8_RHOPB